MFRFDPIIALSIAEQVLKRLRDAILEGRYQPCTALRIDALATELGTSHMPVREALHILTMEGLAVRMHRRGVVVGRIDIDDIDQAYLVLAAFEAEAARVAAERTTSAQVAELGAIAAIPGHAAGIIQRLATNRSLHDAIDAIALIPVQPDGQVLSTGTRQGLWYESRPGEQVAFSRSAAVEPSNPVRFSAPLPTRILSMPNTRSARSISHGRSLLAAILAWGTLSTIATAADEVVLFDAAIAPITAVAQEHSTVNCSDGVLQVAGKAGPGSPGVLITGSWDLAGCNRLSVDMATTDTTGAMQVTIQLANADADLARSRGLFVDRVKVAAGGFAAYDVALPPHLVHGREINARLTGMRRGPLATTGVVADLDPNRVTSVVVCLKDPKKDWSWSLRRIVAHRGALPAVPGWMNLPVEGFFPFIDVYGQFRHRDWPGKVHGDADLVRAREAEQADLIAHPGPAGWSRFGGWAQGPRRQATGRFRVEKLDGRWWMVDPEGCLYWSHGPVRVTSASAVTPLKGRESYFADLPAQGSAFASFYQCRDLLLLPYFQARRMDQIYDFSSANALRKYGDGWEDAYADLAHRRLRSWGMNTIANGSDGRICRLGRTPYTDRIELKSPDIAGSMQAWWKFKDPFHPEFRSSLRSRLLERKTELDDPWCIGFFVDNEIAWGGPASLAEWTLLSPASQPAKVEMVGFLRKTHADITALNRVWGSAFASWDDLLATKAQPPAGADADCRRFSEVLTEEYFRRISEEFKAVAPDTLYLGCRFYLSTEAAVRMSGKYCDVISYNIYAPTLEWLKLPAGVDRPVMIGEFHFGALDRGLFHASGIQVADQQARGKAYAAYVTSALRHPNIVGAHWHQFGDQATTGRFDGENFQNGLVDVCDTPYPETIVGVREVGYRMYDLRLQP